MTWEDRSVAPAGGDPDGVPLLPLAAMVQTDRAPGDDEEQVSWLAATPGMPVVASDGGEVGHVEEISGLPEDDIFHGIVYKARSTSRLAPASDVRRITVRAVYLTVDSAATEQHPEQ